MRKGAKEDARIFTCFNYVAKAKERWRKKHRRMAVRRNRSRIASPDARQDERIASFRPPPQKQDFLNNIWMGHEEKTVVRWGTP